MTRRFRRRHALVFLALVAVVVVCLTPWAGTLPLSPGSVFGRADTMEGEIFWKLRLPRVLTGFVAGFGLAVAGAVFQSLFRNPLADPFVLGVSSGASAGVAVALCVGGGTVAVAGGWMAVESVFAFAGALLAMAAVFGIARFRRGGDTASVLLAGVAVNFFFSSLILLLQHLADPANAARMFRSMIGGIAVAGQRQLLVAAPFVLLGTLTAAMHWRELDILSLGEDEALTRGVDTARVRRRLLVGMSLMVGGITALCGPVGFVGLMAPHICRMLAGPGHGALLAASGLFGGAFLVLADLAARMIIRPAELPVGVISSLCGVPFFVWLLVRKRP